MKKDKKWYIATGAGLGMIFGYAIWNAGIGLVLGAAIGSIIFASNKGRK
jgi:multidrug transporter EmrE-like cation transporter